MNSSHGLGMLSEARPLCNANIRVASNVKLEDIGEKESHCQRAVEYLNLLSLIISRFLFCLCHMVPSRNSTVYSHCWFDVRVICHFNGHYTNHDACASERHRLDICKLPLFINIPNLRCYMYVWHAVNP
jgi:hypothetical protein